MTETAVCASPLGAEENPSRLGNFVEQLRICHGMIWRWIWDNTAQEGRRAVLAHLYLQVKEDGAYGYPHFVEIRQLIGSTSGISPDDFLNYAAKKFDDLPFQVRFYMPFYFDDKYGVLSPGAFVKNYKKANEGA